MLLHSLHTDPTTRLTSETGAVMGKSRSAAAHTQPAQDITHCRTPRTVQGMDKYCLHATTAEVQVADVHVM